MGKVGRAGSMSEGLASVSCVWVLVVRADHHWRLHGGVAAVRGACALTTQCTLSKLYSCVNNSRAGVVFDDGPGGGSRDKMARPPRPFTARAG